MFNETTKVLVVDDMKTMRKIIRSGLKKLGMSEVVEAEDGSQAWMMLRESKGKQGFDLIISDWNMPQMTGIELLKHVRADADLKEMPFLMITAEAEQAAVVEAVKEKVSNYVVKPFSPEVLAEKLKQVYKKHFGE